MRVRWLIPLLCAAALHAQPRRGLLVCVSDSAPAEIRAAAESVWKAVPQNALLTAFANSGTPATLCSSQALASGPVEPRAYNHLVLVGLPSDPMIAAASQHEARPEAGGYYVFGFGHLKGDIGYIESDRNPFLHAAAIKKTPFETEVVTITGSTPAGVKAAAAAFVTRLLVNGVVAAPGWQRGQPNLLERDPLPPGFSLPSWLPARAGKFTLIGVTQGGEDEYRGVLADTHIEPQEIWRAKYYSDEVWDGEGEAHAFSHYSAGLHRRAYGNTIWMARFASADEAAKLAPLIAQAAGLKAGDGIWSGTQPSFAGGNYAGDTDSSGTLSLWHRQAWVFMSTLSIGVVTLPR